MVVLGMVVLGMVILGLVVLGMVQVPELCADCKNIKIFEGLSNSKNMVFNVKKLLNVGLGLALRRNGGKNRCERNERQI